MEDEIAPNSQEDRANPDNKVTIDIDVQPMASFPVAPENSNYKELDEKLLKNEQELNKYNFKDEPIELLSISGDQLEINSEFIKFVTALKEQKLSILTITGQKNSGKTLLSNCFINKMHAFNGKKSVWVWGNPMTLDNGSKLLILDSQGLEPNDENSLSKKLFSLSALISSCLIYNTNNICEQVIDDFAYFSDLSKQIDVDEVDKEQNTVDNLCKFFPELIWVVNNFDMENGIRDNILDNPKLENSKKLFKDVKYFYLPAPTDDLEKLKNLEDKSVLNDLYIKSIDDLKNNIEKSIKIKTINPKQIDGSSLFGIIQNYLEKINSGENIIINQALENILLSRAKDISEQILEEFKKEFHLEREQKEKKQQLTDTDIIDIYFNLQKDALLKYCKNVENLLNISQIGGHLNELFDKARLEVKTVLSTNENIFDEIFTGEYNQIKSENQSDKELASFDEIKSFIQMYTNNFEKTLDRLANMPLNKSAISLLALVKKIFTEFVLEKLLILEEKIVDKHEKTSKEDMKNIENLNATIDNLNQQLESKNKLLEQKIEENKELNKNYMELDKKYDKLNRDNKIKEYETQNKLSILEQKNLKLEKDNMEQSKEKLDEIGKLESKMQKLNQEILGTNSENTKKINELTRENNRLQLEIERMKEQEKKRNNDFSEQQKFDFSTMFKTVQNVFIDFKDRVNKLEEKNENVFKKKYLENSTQEFENKLKIYLEEVKQFFDSQVKTMEKDYEKESDTLKTKIGQLEFEMEKQESTLKNELQNKQILDKKLEETEKQIQSLNEMMAQKDNLIKSEQDLNNMYETNIESIKKQKEDLEMKLSQTIINFQLKDDELETVTMVIESILSKKKDKYEHNLSRLSQEIQDSISAMVKNYKAFK